MVSPNAPVWIQLLICWQDIARLVLLIKLLTPLMLDQFSYMVWLHFLEMTFRKWFETALKGDCIDMTDTLVNNAGILKNSKITKQKPLSFLLRPLCFLKFM